MSRQVQFTYFKQSGKYYSSEYQEFSDPEYDEEWYDTRVYEWAKYLQQNRTLPGLREGGGSEFFILVETEDGVPCLLMPLVVHDVTVALFNFRMEQPRLLPDE